MSRATWIGLIGRRGYALVAMSRPAFLLGTVPLYLVGVTAAYRASHDLRIVTAILGLAVVLAVQAMTHYNNEYWDVEADRGVERPRRISAGSGVIVDGVVQRGVARGAARACFVVALLLTASTVLLADAGEAFLGLVGVGVLCGWFYSSPPIRLVSRGVGEIVVAGVVGFLVPATGYLLQASTLDASFVLVTLPLLPLAFAASVATAIPDVESDGRTGKRTLPVRVGLRSAVVLDGLAIVFGWLLFGRVVAEVGALLGLVAFVVLLGQLAVFLVVAGAAMDGSTADAERLALVVLVIFGWTGLSTSATILSG